MPAWVEAKIWDFCRLIGDLFVASGGGALMYFLFRGLFRWIFKTIDKEEQSYEDQD